MLRGSMATAQYHNASMMWRGHESGLTTYTDYVLREMVLRGYPSEVPSPRTPEGIKLLDIPSEWGTKEASLPEWIGVERIHASHRSILLRKDPAWYAQFSWDDAPVSAISWPGKMLTPGDSALGPKGQVELVVSMETGTRYPILESGLIVTRRDVYNGVWRRCVRRD
jgi:hypothetical protein